MRFQCCTDSLWRISWPRAHSTACTLLNSFPACLTQQSMLESSFSLFHSATIPSTASDIWLGTLENVRVNSRLFYLIAHFSCSPDCQGSIFYGIRCPGSYRTLFRLLDVHVTLYTPATQPRIKVSNFLSNEHVVQSLILKHCNGLLDALTREWNMESVDSPFLRYIF